MKRIGRLLIVPLLALGVGGVLASCSFSIGFVKAEPIQVGTLSESAVLLDVRSVAQGGPYDCGLVAVGAVAQYFGHPLQESKSEELRLLAADQESLSVQDMTKALKLAGMDVYAFKGDLGPTISGIPYHLRAGRPCIVLLKRDSGSAVGHFVVVCGHDPDRRWVILSDPEHHIVAVSYEDFQRIWDHANTVLLVAAPTR